jgi:hypothetical protein
LRSPAEELRELREHETGEAAYEGVGEEVAEVEGGSAQIGGEVVGDSADNREGCIEGLGGELLELAEQTRVSGGSRT